MDSVDIMVSYSSILNFFILCLHFVTVSIKEFAILSLMLSSYYTLLTFLHCLVEVQ